MSRLESKFKGIQKMLLWPWNSAHVKRCVGNRYALPGMEATFNLRGEEATRVFSRREDGDRTESHNREKPIWSERGPRIIFIFQIERARTCFEAGEEEF